MLDFHASLGHYFLVLLAVVMLGLFSSLAGNKLSEITYIVSGETLNLNSVSQSYHLR